jgi:hypothetical protein
MGCNEPGVPVLTRLARKGQEALQPLIPQPKAAPDQGGE